MDAPSHHPDEPLLLAYAAGVADAAAELVVATHLALCPTCRATVHGLERVGGALLVEHAPASLAAGSLDAVLARLAATPPARLARRGGDPRLPEPLRSALGPWEEAPWIQVGGGSQVVGLPIAGVSARVASLAPHAAVPFHTHRGRELLLVLTGSFDDGLARYARGDVSIADEHLQHDMRILPGETCIALVVRDSPIREVRADGQAGEDLPGF